MGFQTLEILRQGVWASITGGYHYDPHHNLFCNTFHFYSWMLLVLLPFIVYLWSSFSWFPWVAYSGVILLIFSTIKTINLQLHTVFDKSEPVEERCDDRRTWRYNQTNSDVEDIELQVLSTKQSRSRSSSISAPSQTCQALPFGAESENPRLLESYPTKTDAGLCDQSQGARININCRGSTDGGYLQPFPVNIHAKDGVRHSTLKANSGQHGEHAISFDDHSTSLTAISLKLVEREESRNPVELLERSPRSSVRPVSSDARRFSNISELAFELCSTIHSAPRLQAAGGSLELGFVNRPTQTSRNKSSPSAGGQASVRRTLSAVETSIPLDLISSSPAYQTQEATNYLDDSFRLRAQTDQDLDPQQRPHPEPVNARSLSSQLDYSGASVSQAAMDASGIQLGVNNQIGEDDALAAQYKLLSTSTPQNLPAHNSSVLEKDEVLPSGDISSSQQIISPSTACHCSSVTEGTVPEKGLIPQPCSCSEVKNEGTVAQSSACFMCSARNNIEKELVGYLPLEQLLCPPPSQLSSSGRTTCVAVHPSTPPGDDFQDLGVVPKRRQHLGVDQIDEESGEDVVAVSPYSCYQDEFSQFTPPKRRKLAARRRRHPAGNNLPIPERSFKKSEVVSGCDSSAIGDGQHARVRRQSASRPRRRRRTSTPGSSSLSPSACELRKDLFHPNEVDCSGVTECDGTRRTTVKEKSQPFVVPPASRQWLVDSGSAFQSDSVDGGATNTNLTTISRSINLSFGESNGVSAPNSSSLSLASGLPTIFPSEGQRVLFQSSVGIREHSREERFELDQVRTMRDYSSHPGRVAARSSTNPSSVGVGNVTGFFGSSTLHGLLDNSPTGHNPFQLVGTSSLASTEGASESVSTRLTDSRHPFILPRNTVDSINEALGRFSNHVITNNNHNDATLSSEEDQPSPPVLPLVKSRRYYRFQLWPSCIAPSIKIRFDRLALLALFDRNISIWDSILCVVLAVTVGILTALVLRARLFQDAVAFLFCLICAGCQYSLLKSVQPDAASPTHGHNRLAAFSRPVYFILLVSLLLVADWIVNQLSQVRFTAPVVSFYGANLGSVSQVMCLRDFLLNLVLCFPIIFSLGLLPQISTFTTYLFEQVEIHVFGGTAVTGLGSAVYAVTRSCFLVVLVYGPAYGGLKEPTSSQHLLFSSFCALLVAACYHVSRSSADPSVLLGWVSQTLAHRDPGTSSCTISGQDVIIDGGSKAGVKHGTPHTAEATRSPAKQEAEDDDDLPRRMQETVIARLRSDVIVSFLYATIVFGVHCSTVFTSRHLQPILNDILWISSAVLGLVLHYIVPQLRKQLPWLCFSGPVFRSREHNQFEIHQPAELMWFERTTLWLTAVERYVLLPALFLDSLTRDSPLMVTKFGTPVGTLLSVLCGMKAIRSGFTDPSSQYLVITFSKLLFSKDFASAGYSEAFLVDYFFVSVLASKLDEFILKLQFIVTYIAPWQITWGSAFHAFAQPFSVPHSAMLFVQAAVSSLISAPLSPFLGSAIFFTSYARPVKFWERDYNTRRMDASNTRLASQLEPSRIPGGDDNNLNSIFYEHLTRSLQKSLAGDLMLGRWGGPISQGDCFVLASDNLNCLVHLIELANGVVTFQVRGLEFRGTYCQQREVEAISEGVEEDDGCCCCEPGHLPHMLGFNAAFNQRWLAWQVMATKYVLEGYSISDNNAASMLHVFDLRRILVTYYVKSIIYYAARSTRLEVWLSNPSIEETLHKMSSDNLFVDLDPVFNINIDEDYDYHSPGITRASFCSVYLGWIQYCAARREKPLEAGRDSLFVSLCFALSLLGRRALGSAAHTSLSSVEFFLYGLHALFKGDFRITSFRDEWVFNDIDLLKNVISPGIRMAVKLHQDHFQCPDDFDEPSFLYEAISNHEEKLIISHESDPAWRRAILSNANSLLALRHVVDDNSDEYKIIMLNKRFLSFRVIKLNRECVRGLWAGQQQELVYLRNRNQERGSIQNAKQVLRNIINSSCDQPIGYPIYVSPLMTSFADTHPQIRQVLGAPLSMQAIQRTALALFHRIQTRCREACAGRSGSHCPEAEVSLENMRSTMAVMPGSRQSLPRSASVTATAAFSSSSSSNQGGYQPFSCFPNTLGASESAGIGTCATRRVTGGGPGLSSVHMAAQSRSVRSRLGQPESVVSAGSAATRKPFGSTLSNLAASGANTSVFRDPSGRIATVGTYSPPDMPSVATESGVPLLGSSPTVCDRQPSGTSEVQEGERDRPRRKSQNELRTTLYHPVTLADDSRQKSFAKCIDKEGGPSGLELSNRRECDWRDRSEKGDCRLVGESETSSFKEDGIRVDQTVKIVDPLQVYDTINLGRRIDVLWPNPNLRIRGGKSYWKNWLPEAGMQGIVVHRWVPNHPDARQRSHVDRVILLLVIEDKYVPIAESAVELVCFSEAKKDSASQDTETLSYPSADQPI